MALYLGIVYLELGNASGWPDRAHAHRAQLARVVGQQALMHAHWPTARTSRAVQMLTSPLLAQGRCVCAHVRVPPLRSCGPVSLSPPTIRPPSYNGWGHCSTICLFLFCPMF